MISRRLPVSRPFRRIRSLLLLTVVCLSAASLGADAARKKGKKKPTESIPGPVVAAGTRLTLTLLPNNRYGAKCLDGSPPGYFFRPGFGSGSSSWHVHLQYGGWCYTLEKCKERSLTWLGSSNADLQNQNPWKFANWGYMGILSINPVTNPRFYNWNLVVPIYCDGGGFAGRAGFKNVSETEGVYLDGWKIIKAVLTDVTDYKGLKTASQVLLSGVSAGAEAVVTLCDQLPALVPSAKTTKCLMDSGFFLDALDMNKRSAFRKRIQLLAGLHVFVGNPRCSRATNQTKKWKCFFPEHSLPFVRSPFFVVNSLFDGKALNLGNQLPESNNTFTYQCLSEIMAMPSLRRSIPSTPPNELAWKNSNKKCTLSATRAVLAYAQKMWTVVGAMEDKKLKAFLAWSSKHGIMVDSSWVGMKENGKVLRDVVAEWYFNS
ncbi:hypothetical protein CLOM_g16837 [Closterium sp. NIES-68]|nr:hypothetical protein CLOM_g16837 [Closterium sp. NIES-68]